MLQNQKKNRGVLLINLGTPAAPSPLAVWRYLSEFLTDSRVIDIPWLQRQLLVRGVIIPTRFLSSTKAYQAIWTAEGSPLLVYGNRVQAKLQEKLGEGTHVQLAMRYQTPSLKTGLQILMEKKLDELIILPLFPQYASATTGSIFAKLTELMSQYAIVPRTTFIDQFASHPALIEAFRVVGAEANPSAYDHVLFSFHGLPVRQLCQPDLAGKGCCQSSQQRFCYASQCYATANGIAAALNLPSAHYSVAFQSRLGKDPWIEPFTVDRIRTLAQQGHKKILVFCPSFVADCLETLYEIKIEYNELFHKAGGQELVLVPGLNDHPAWIEALGKIVNGAT